MAWYDVGKAVRCMRSGYWREGPGVVKETEIRIGENYIVGEVYAHHDSRIFLRPVGLVGFYNIGFFKPLRSTETGFLILKEIAARKREPEGIEV